jgi:hypothetical protein
VELYSKSLLEQLAALLREYWVPGNGISREPATKELCESLCATKAHGIKSVQSCCIRDEGRPLGAAMQVEASNRPLLQQ